MVAFYVMKINDGTITIDDVPKIWKEKVQQMLGEESNAH